MEKEKNITNLPPSGSLAYLGDARHSLYVRKMLIESGIVKSGELNKKALDYVTCEAQARMYEKIRELLTDEEADVFRRAANSTHLNKPKRASGRDYRYATGYEAVVGMLEWLGREDRLEFLLKKSHEKEFEDDTEN